MWASIYKQCPKLINLTLAYTLQCSSSCNGQYILLSCADVGCLEHRDNGTRCSRHWWQCRWWQGNSQPCLTGWWQDKKASRVWLVVARLKSTVIDWWWWQGKRQPCLTDGGNVKDGGKAKVKHDWLMVARLMLAREHCYSCVEVLGKLLIPCCLCPPSSNGYLVKSAADVLNSPQEIYQGR